MGHADEKSSADTEAFRERYCGIQRRKALCAGGRLPGSDGSAAYDGHRVFCCLQQSQRAEVLAYDCITAASGCSSRRVPSCQAGGSSSVFGGRS